MIAPPLSTYAQQIAKECGADEGEILFPVFLGCRVPKELEKDAKTFRAMVRKER